MRIGDLAGAHAGPGHRMGQLLGCYPPLDCPAIIPEPSAGISVGAWRSLAARIVRDDEVGGSNPLAPTISTSSIPNASGRPRAAASNVGSIIAFRRPSTLTLAKSVSARALRSSGPTADHHSGSCSR